MTDNELWELFERSAASVGEGRFPKVRVTGGDYVYDGWLIAVYQKRSGQVRCNVEDVTKRIFVHNAGQLADLDETS